jgi:CheY-like chemotaxis protein
LTVNIRAAQASGQALRDFLVSSAHREHIEYLEQASVRAETVGDDPGSESGCGSSRKDSHGSSQHGYRLRSEVGKDTHTMAPKILIVEDTPLNMELATDILEVAGFEVLAAVDAAQCFHILASHRPDLVLMDVQLPGKDGLQITRELRANPDTRDLTIVAMTAHAMVEDERRVMEAGCDGYLTKPIQTRTLVERLTPFLGDKRRRPGSHPGHDARAS